MTSLTLRATDATNQPLWRHLAATWRAQPLAGAYGGRAMDQASIGRIRESFAQVAAIGGPAAILFYQKLFRIDPSARAVFARPDMRAQGTLFIAALGYAVATLDKPARLLPVAQDLARRHAARGLRPEHYRPIGEALDWMLEKCLAEDFTPELRAAWREAYRRVTAFLLNDELPARAA